MSFEKEVEKIGGSVEAVTSRWKTWAFAGLFVFAAVIAVYAAVRFLF